jgi:hypothetical protein
MKIIILHENTIHTQYSHFYETIYNARQRLLIKTYKLHFLIIQFKSIKDQYRIIITNNINVNINKLCYLRISIQKFCISITEHRLKKKLIVEG